MANNLRCSAAEESEDTLNAFTSPTGYEPKLLAFDELYDSSVPFSFMIPSSDQDMDDLTLGKLLTEAHRGQADNCVPRGMSVSQSSSSVMFDGSGQPDGKRMVDRSGQPDVTLTHDENFGICHFLGVSTIMKPPSVPYGLRISVEKSVSMNEDELVALHSEKFYQVSLIDRAP